MYYQSAGPYNPVPVNSQAYHFQTHPASLTSQARVVDLTSSSVSLNQPLSYTGTGPSDCRNTAIGVSFNFGATAVSVL